MLLLCAISGFSSVYFEGMLKRGDFNLGVWHRNFQLAFFSVILLYGLIWYEFVKSFPTDTVNSFHPVLFRGWTMNTVLIMLIQSGGGLLVAASLKFADAIHKTLATSGSIFLSAILGWMLLGGQLDIFVALGGIATILAIFNYSFDSSDSSTKNAPLPPN